MFAKVIVHLPSRPMTDNEVRQFIRTALVDGEWGYSLSQDPQQQEPEPTRQAGAAAPALERSTPKPAYKVLRTDRASMPENLRVGDLLYAVGNDYGVAADDSRMTGWPHVAVSHDPSGNPFFTIPREDVAVNVQMSIQSLERVSEFARQNQVNRGTALGQLPTKAFFPEPLTESERVAVRNLLYGLRYGNQTRSAERGLHSLLSEDMWNWCATSGHFPHKVSRDTWRLSYKGRDHWGSSPAAVVRSARESAGIQEGR